MKNVESKRNWPLVGNKQITEFLDKSISNDNVCGTYIFNGPDNLGKTTVAKFFAQSLLCTTENEMILRRPCGKCPSCRAFSYVEKDRDEDSESEQNRYGDFYMVSREKDKKNITVEQVRRFINSVSMSSFLNSYKIGIIKHADSLSIEASNALLKTLEEPRENTIIILVTHDLDSLPATIVSRSKVLNFRPVNSDIIYDYLVDNFNSPRSMARDLSRLCQGRPALAVKFYEDEDFRKKYLEKAALFINFASQDINARFISVSELLGGAKGQELVKIAKRTLEVWIGVARDCLLVDFDNVNLIQHFQLEQDIKRVKNNFNSHQILSIIKKINYADTLIDANVNPKTALEAVAISI